MLARQLSLRTKQLTHDEQRRHCKPSLYFNYNERYHHGHICETSSPLLLQDQPMSEDSRDDDVQQMPDTLAATQAIEASPVTLHAMVGESSPKSLKLQG